MKILDCTLRDGANVVGLGFNRELTKMMIEGLIEAGIDLIEMGNAHGIGVNEPGSPLTDEEYLDLLKPYLGKAEFGMFLQSKAASEQVTELAVQKGLSFLRVGNSAGNGKDSVRAIELVKKSGLFCRYSLMKAYVLDARQLAEEARFLEKSGVDEITIMDSAGTMLPQEVGEYVRRMKEAVSVPVGFHGHNNLGLAVANSCTALENGADVIDVGLMGMARSAGNTPTEVLIAVLQRMGRCQKTDLFGLLSFIDKKLSPVMEKYHYHNTISPLDLVYGQSGCHSNFGEMFAQVAKERKVSLYRLIAEVSAINRKAPTRELLEKTADIL